MDHLAPDWARMSWTPVKLALAALLTVAGPARAQAPDDWNAPRALELIERARQRRAEPDADSALVNYRASAGGYVYFYLDRKDSEERTLVKVDQIALEVYWGAPSHTKQRIVGLRDAKKLPNNIHYHLDHLTVVQNEFDDRIRMGDGDEVRDVLHPAAPGADSVYDFRLADSLSLHLPGAREPVRVYEIEVRPGRLDRPALIGSVFLDRGTAAIVRMSFTFTPASYVDPRLDYIRVSLDNGLWEGRYWLPNEQKLEIRRQVPELDFPAGGVIRGVLRIGDYRFNQELPAGFFLGSRVVALPRSLRESYDFAAGIFEGLDDEGITAPTELAALRRQAAELVGQRYLSGLPRLRIFLPSASSVLRYNRAEGVFLGAGASYIPGEATRLDVSGGFATGPGHLSTAASLRHDLDERTRVRLRAERHGLRDVGMRPGTAGVLNTLHAAVAGEDHLDPYYATGLGVEVERRLAGAWRADFDLSYERHTSGLLEEPAALLDGTARFRPVRAVDEGSLLGARIALLRSESADRASDWSGKLALEGGAFEGEAFLRPTLEFSASRRSADRRTTVELRGAAGLAAGEVPAQRLFLFGGRATLPGYEYRGFAGDRFALAELEASREIIGPWIRLRALSATGWTDFGSASLPAGWNAGPTGGARTSVGIGLGLVYDVLRLDLVRGLNGGEQQVILSVNPRLWDIL